MEYLNPFQVTNNHTAKYKYLIPVDWTVFTRFLRALKYSKCCTDSVDLEEHRCKLSVVNYFSEVAFSSSPILQVDILKINPH